MHIISKLTKILKSSAKLIVVAISILIGDCYFMLAQSGNGEMFYIADDYIDNENFTGAINLYQRMLDEEPDNPTVNFKLGFCYLNTADEKDKAIKYIEKSVSKLNRGRKRKSTEFLEASFYLAKAYQANYKFDKAVTQYTSLKERTKNKQLIAIIDEEIKKCADGNALVQNPVQLTITNLGDSINTEYGDHSPFISADESVLIFTSRRENKYNDEMDMSGEYDENIYISYSEEGSPWSKPVSIGDSINTAEHEASIGISVDGQKLFIYKSDEEGSIYVSDLIGDIWSKPKKLGPTINTKYRETHASLSADGSKLYFTSDRKGGYGGLDIYVARKLVNGEWSEAENLGPGINTEKDERAPYIHPDDITLYFSSRGHGGLGGFDIFSSQLNEFGTWTKPQNIGYPINTSSDDVFYVTSADRQRSYYASSKEAGMGKTDLYLIGLKEVEESNLTIMTGKMYICRGELPEVSITVMDAETDEVVGIYTPNSKSGKFLFVLNRGGHYNVVFEADGEIINEEKLVVPDDAAYQQLYKAVQIPVDPPCNEKELALVTDTEYTDGVNIDNIDENGIVYDASIKIENILFPSNKTQLMDNNASLNKLAEHLSSNPGAVIEVGAYADASGRAVYNYQLSVKRGNSIKEYLIKRNAKPEQIEVVGYGEENPICLNKNKDGTWNKQGQKFNRRIEFRVKKQGNATILVKPIIDIPEDLKNKNYQIDYKKDPEKHIETQI